MSVAALHILASGWDQFVANVLRQEGQLHQVRSDKGETFLSVCVAKLDTTWGLIQLKIFKSKRLQI